MKIIILGLLFLIIVSLFVALYTLVKDRGQSNRTVRALTMRVALSILLILILLISYKAGLIHPNYSPFDYKNKSALEHGK
ncbi:MAG: twin transmembrane helix small protein [Gammaproteobacteria bacterium]|nr:twin transmembrane helix small protein [Gammaproteobacteria bacterium]